MRRGVGLAVLLWGGAALPAYGQVKLAAAAALMRAKENGRNCVEIEAVASDPAADDILPPPGGVASA